MLNPFLHRAAVNCVENFKLVAAQHVNYYRVTKSLVTVTIQCWMDDTQARCLILLHQKAASFLMLQQLINMTNVKMPVLKINCGVSFNLDSLVVA